MFSQYDINSYIIILKNNRGAYYMENFNFYVISLINGKFYEYSIGSTKKWQLYIIKIANVYLLMQ